MDHIVRDEEMVVIVVALVKSKEYGTPFYHGRFLCIEPETVVRGPVPTPYNDHTFLEQWFILFNLSLSPSSKNLSKKYTVCRIRS